MTDKEKLEKALLKKALGYTAKEVSEEYSKVDDDLVLSKRKLNTKSYPPDLASLQLMLSRLDKEDEEFKNMTDAELLHERDRLIKLLEKEEKSGTR